MKVEALGLYSGGSSFMIQVFSGIFTLDGEAVEGILHNHTVIAQCSLMRSSVCGRQ